MPDVRSVQLFLGLVIEEGYAPAARAGPPAAATRSMPAGRGRGRAPRRRDTELPHHHREVTAAKGPAGASAKTGQALTAGRRTEDQQHMAAKEGAGRGARSPPCTSQNRDPRGQAKRSGHGGANFLAA